MILIIALCILWLFPYFVIMGNLIVIFHKKRDYLKKNKKNKKIMVRETFLELRYLFPIVNWKFMSQLVLHYDFIESYIESKLQKNIA